MSLFQILAICGMLSPILYTAMWILGGVLQQDYSHVKTDISALIASGAPNKKLLDKFIISSSILLFIFYLGLHWGVAEGNGSIIGPVLFICSSILGILVAVYFPLDEGGEIITTRGKMHLILVVIMGILTIGGMVDLWYRLANVSVWMVFATYSLISAIVALVFVIVSGIFIMSDYRGLLERFSVCTYQIYYFVLALMVFIMN